jgi:CRP-like cAMP-binding protein
VIHVVQPKLCLWCPPRVAAGRCFQVYFAFVKPSAPNADETTAANSTRVAGGVDGGGGKLGQESAGLGEQEQAVLSVAKRARPQELMLRSAAVTRGDKLLIRAHKVNCSPPADVTLPVPEWSAEATVDVGKGIGSLHLPGCYSIQYLSATCGLLAETRLHIHFTSSSGEERRSGASIVSGRRGEVSYEGQSRTESRTEVSYEGRGVSPVLSAPAQSRELSCFIALDCAGRLEAEQALFMQSVEHAMHRLCEYFGLAFTPLYFSDDIPTPSEGPDATTDTATASKGDALILRKISDVDKALPYLIVVLPSPDTYGKRLHIRMPKHAEPISPADTGHHVVQGVTQEHEQEASKTNEQPAPLGRTCMDVETGQVNGIEERSVESLCERDSAKHGGLTQRVLKAIAVSRLGGEMEMQHEGAAGGEFEEGGHKGGMADTCQDLHAQLDCNYCDNAQAQVDCDHTGSSPSPTPAQASSTHEGLVQRMRAEVAGERRLKHQEDIKHEHMQQALADWEELIGSVREGNDVDFSCPMGMPGQISHVTRIWILRKSPLLAQTHHSDLRSLARETTLRKIEAGTDLIRNGAISSSMYSVVAGSLSVLLAGDTIEVAQVKPGNIVGEMSLLTGAPAVATCRASKGCMVLEITRASLMRVVQSKPSLQAHLNLFIQARLRANANDIQARLRANAEKMRESREIAEEEQMLNDDSASLLDVHPWLSVYRNEHLEPRDGQLPASVFELVLAYGLLLDPERASRCVVLSRFSQRQQACCKAPPALQDRGDSEVAEDTSEDYASLAKAGEALHERICQLVPCRAYAEPSECAHLCLEFLSQALVRDFGDGKVSPLFHDRSQLLRNVHLPMQQVLGFHLGGVDGEVGEDGGVLLLCEDQLASLQSALLESKMVLVKGPPCSGKTHLLCQAIQRLRMGGDQKRSVVLMHDDESMPTHLPCLHSTPPAEPASLHQCTVLVSVNFSQHHALHAHTLYDLLFKLALELQAVGVADVDPLNCQKFPQVISPDVISLKQQIRVWIQRAVTCAHLVWIIDSGECLNMVKSDWEWLQRVWEEEGQLGMGLTLVIAHESASLPARLARFCSPVIDLEQSQGGGRNLEAAIGCYLSRKGHAQLLGPIAALVQGLSRLHPEDAEHVQHDDEDSLAASIAPAFGQVAQPEAPVLVQSESAPGVAESEPAVGEGGSGADKRTGTATRTRTSRRHVMSAGCMRLVIEWALFRAASPDLSDAHAFEKASAVLLAKLRRNSMGAALTLLEGIDARHRSFGDCLRMLAIARAGLLPSEMIALFKAANPNAMMNAARFSRMRELLIERRVLVVLGGVLDFASTGLREAAHSLFELDAQRLAYVKTMLTWLRGRPLRSPRRLVLLGNPKP